MKRSLICSIGALLLLIERTEGAISSHPSKFDHIHMHEHHHREEKRKHENRRAVEQAIYEYQKKVESGEIDHETEKEKHREIHKDVHMDHTEHLDLEYDPHSPHYLDPYGFNPDDPMYEHYMDHQHGRMTDEELEARKHEEAARYGDYHDPGIFENDTEL